MSYDAPPAVPSAPPRFGEEDWGEAALAARREWVGVDTPHIAGRPTPPEAARGNIEGMIGHVQVPLGVAGPLVLRGDAAGAWRVPFATTEGTLVASYQRGMKVAAEAGGIDVHLLGAGLAVYPTLAFADVAAALAAARWVEAHRAELVAAAEGTTRHGRVLRLDPTVLGRRLLLELEMHTGDAHGINMVTRAAGALCALVPGAGQVLLHGFDVEKRASGQRGRGRRVVADLRVPKELVTRAWRTDAARLAELWQTYSLGFARMGTHTHAIQVANGLAAIYLATGQDVAYVTESAACTLCLEDRGGDLYASLDLPNLHAATVGGGTQKGTAAEAQRIVGAPDASTLACVIAGALLAGDLNLAGSFLGDDFTGAHERLGRNRPV